MADYYDHDVRKILRDEVLPILVDDARVIDEMGLGPWGDCRIDIMAVSSGLHGFEIKSANDTLERLKLQIEGYGAVCDLMTLVVDTKFLARVQLIAPLEWGLIVVTQVEQHFEFVHLRKARLNLRVTAKKRAEILWKEEAYALLKKYGHSKYMSEECRENLADKLVAVLTLPQIKEETTAMVLARKYYTGYKRRRAFTGVAK